MATPVNAKYVWYNPHGQGRNRFASFRKVLRLSGQVRHANLNLFADNVYQLWVNNVFVGFGPIRFDIRYPKFDTYDLRPYLTEGENVISVLVNSFGCKTFRDNSERGGFISWGDVQLATGEEFQLDSQTWKARRCDAFDENAVKMSFALEAINVYSQEADEDGWRDPGYDDSSWKPAVELTEQSSWGSLEPRGIRYFDLQEVAFAARDTVSSIKPSLEIASFSVPYPNYHTNEKHFAGDGKYGIVVSTFIYSPVAQEVCFYGFWGEYFVNGEKLEGVEEYSRLRTEYRITLNSGWNFFFASFPAYEDCLNFYWAYPKNQGIELSPNAELGDGVAFARSEPIPVKMMGKLVRSVPLPLPFDRSLDTQCGWISVRKEESETNPARRSLWDDYRDSGLAFSGKALPGRTFPIETFPNGFVVHLEFEKTELVFPEIVLEGAAGAQVDFAYSEHLLGSGRHLGHTHLYVGGDRIHPEGKQCRFMTSQPRGARYINMTVRGATQDVTINEIRFRRANYPVDRIGAFQCSDDTLTRVWKICEQTQRTNMEDVFVDCVGRERGMYIRDSVIQFHNAMAAYGDVELMGRCMELYGQSSTDSGLFRAVYPNHGDYTICDFAIEIVNGYWRYYQATGDLKRIVTDWESIRSNVEWFNELSDENEYGLLDADWPKNRGTYSEYGGLHGDNGIEKKLLDRSGPNANLTFPYIIMLDSAAKLAREIGLSEEANGYDLRRKRVTGNARRAFWNSELGCYNDNLKGTTQSPHASLLAVLSGVAEETSYDELRAFLRSSFKGTFINGKDPQNGALYSPSYSFFLFEALYKLGLPGLVEAHIREGWGWVLDVGLPTVPEFFSLEESLCHAWSATPLYFLSKMALGVFFPEAPNFDRIVINPCSHLQWAEGSFPIPGSGDSVHVKWKRSESGVLSIEYEAPEWTTIELIEDKDPEALANTGIP